MSPFRQLLSIWNREIWLAIYNRVSNILLCDPILVNTYLCDPVMGRYALAIASSWIYCPLQRNAYSSLHGLPMRLLMTFVIITGNIILLWRAKAYQEQLKVQPHIPFIMAMSLGSRRIVWEVLIYTIPRSGLTKLIHLDARSYIHEQCSWTIEHTFERR